MTYRQFTKKILEEDGWYFLRNGKGSHKIWAHPVKQRILSIPDHGAKEIGKGLLNTLLKDADLK